MTDYSVVRSLASDLSLTEATVGTLAVTESLAAFKRATLELDSSDPFVGRWLSDEHFAGGVFATAATVNKRAELSSTGNAFDRVPRSEMVERFNRWAAQLVDRIDAVQNGTASPAQFLPQLAQFKSDPINNNP